jgi:RNA polymerase-binding transcription factor DksA
VDDKELNAFRTMLLGLRRRLANNLNTMQNEALRTGERSRGELSEMPLEHLADRGSETFARDLIISIMQNSELEFWEIDNALEKIQEGTYGRCENCQEEIARERLRALPFARLCIKCKQAEERESAGT